MNREELVDSVAKAMFPLAWGDDSEDLRKIALTLAETAVDRVENLGFLATLTEWGCATDSLSGDAIVYKADSEESARKAIEDSETLVVRRTTFWTDVDD